MPDDAAGAVDVDRRRHRRDPAQHHPRPRPRPPERATARAGPPVPRPQGRHATKRCTMTEFLRVAVRIPDNRTMARARARAGAPTRSAATNIHDDATAQKLGFRGGTIAGSIHMDQFPPVLMDAFGPEWFETGSLSLAFKNATISGDPVIAMVGVPPMKDDVQVEARMEQPDGTVVAEGTASIGSPTADPHLSSIDLRGTDPDEL